LLLRRFTNDLKAQNWPAVLLDLLVVVAGIFLGLQADSWNEDRKARTLEREYLQQLYSDFGRTAEQIKSLAEFHARKADDLSWAVTTITATQLAAEDYNRFRNTFVSMYQLPPLGATMSVYDTMVASADLALLQSQELKSRLVVLEANLEADASLLQYFRQLNSSALDLTREFALVLPNEARTEAALRVDFPAVVEDKFALTIVAGQERIQRIFAEMREDLAQQFRQCRELIREQINGSVPGE